MIDELIERIVYAAAIIGAAYLVAAVVFAGWL